ncbi:GNAT family N-acetyltransferase [Chryseobacterium shigense]|uniref:Acetyltransferase (GNAT) domain-containing protein n=1 Tax=Chryseobacterium shigense TaxID=297244 RepID=A0A1N7I9D7_9FLAO|nr:GNAT family N-acetyltransferase [Chryseobacterium shigense]PQA96883.1 GNAT family N-acetyltransferase [Chryseobacterium shigense]SIS33684.1 Acetyltransferase (GNAT) domain-containing protein [Chryseobacterium shigense]
MEKFTLKKIGQDSDIPYELLLLADETVEAIDRYIFDSDLYLLHHDAQDIAVMALHSNSSTELEIKNMAVAESYRSQGIGSILMDKAKEIAKEKRYTMLVVGTSDTGFQQIKFYEKNGFIKKGLRKNFFIENYAVPMYENGLQMRDMIILAHDLSE